MGQMRVVCWTVRLCFYYVLTVLFIIFQFCVLTTCSKIAPPFYGLERPSLDYELPPLKYGFDELEPYIDEMSVRVHYLDFHKKYVDETNNILKRWRRNTVKGKLMSRMSILEILRNVTHIPAKFRSPLKNFGSGYLNHNLYWAIISPNPMGEHRVPQGQIADEITAKFGSFLEFKATFSDMANNLIGSGYVWLCRNHSTIENTGELVILATHNEDSPLSHGLFPVLGIDVWEHAYLLSLRNDREKYVDNWWFLVDWQHVKELSDWWNRVKFHDEL